MTSSETICEKLACPYGQETIIKDTAENMKLGYADQEVVYEQIHRIDAITTAVGALTTEQAQLPQAA